MNYTHVQRVRILYKTILRLHKGLPEELQAIGNSYVRDEFKRHKNCTIDETATFMTEWTKYAISLTEQLGIRGKPKSKIGLEFDESSISLFKEEQIVQLYELLLASKGIEETKTVEPVEIIDHHKK